MPVQYKQQGKHVAITVGSPERKRWWRNLRDGASVTLVLRGARRPVTAQAYGDEHTTLSLVTAQPKGTERMFPPLGMG